MLNNNFVYETPDFLDIAYIRNVVMQKLATDFVTKGYVRINVADDEYLSGIRTQLPFLGDWLNIYHTPPKGTFLFTLMVTARLLSTFLYQDVMQQVKRFGMSRYQEQSLCSSTKKMNDTIELKVSVLRSIALH